MYPDNCAFLTFVCKTTRSQNHTSNVIDFTSQFSVCWVKGIVTGVISEPYAFSRMSDSKRCLLNCSLIKLTACVNYPQKHL